MKSQIKNSTHFVSSDGEVFNPEGKQMKPRLDKDGYHVVKISINGKRINQFVHRLVATTLITNPENKKTVNHKNGIKVDNRVINLEWATRSENLKHAFKTGLKKPTIAPHGKLNRSIAEEIRTKHKAGMSILDIQAEYGICNASAYNVVKNRTWK